MLLRFETRTTQRRLASKIEAKFKTFQPGKIMGEGWAKCLSGIFNPTSDILMSGFARRAG